MSDAAIRHVNALTLKYELLRELKHWKQSCNKTIKEVAVGVAALREARASVKRQINTAHARLVERLRELEQTAEERLHELVKREEETLKGFLKKLGERKKKIETTETSLKENLIGFKLKRTLEDGKHASLSTRQSLLEIYKYDMATHIEFSLHSELTPILESISSLGSFSLKAKTGNSVNARQNESNNKGNDVYSTYKSASSNDVIYGDDSVKSNGHAKETSIADETSAVLSEPVDERDIIRDMETLFGLDMKYGHSMKPFLDSVKQMSNKYKSHMTPESRQNVNGSVNGSMRLKVEQKKKGTQRPASAIFNNEAPNQSKVRTRLSKSAREDGRHVTSGGNNTCLNDVDMSYIPFEEQGPERQSLQRNKDKNISVRYHDLDFIKEITALSDSDIDKAFTNPPVIDSAYDGIPSAQSSRAPSPGSQASVSTSLSSLSYKPSSSLASAPVYISASDQHASKSYFRYIARFHTKKHPGETDLCRLAGIVALDNGQVVVTDINHLQVMLFGADFHYLDALECPSPCGITTVDTNTVAVTLFHNRKIMLIKVHTIHLERYREFHVNCPDTLYDVVYRGRAYHVLCSSGDVHVLDEEGKQTTILEVRCHGCEARHLEVDVDQGQVFVSGSNRVVCFNTEGEKVWQYTRGPKERRFTPGGLVLYNNRIFVADWCTHRVIELSFEGTHVRDVIVDNIDHPQTIAIQQTTGRVLITQNNLFKQEARSRTCQSI